MKKLFVYCVCSLLCLSAGAAVKRVSGADDLRRAIRTLGEGDTLVLAAGRYAVEGSLPLKRSTVIVGEAGARPEVTISQFVLGVGARHLVFENLALMLGGKVLVGTHAQGEVDIDLIALDNCSVNLGGADGAGLVNSRSANATKNRIGEIRVNDCVVFNGGFPQHFVFAAASTSLTAVERLTLKNSTFACLARGIAVSNAPMLSQIVVDRCTFYDINSSDNPAGVIRLSNARADIRITNTVFGFAGPKTRFVMVGTGSKVVVENSCGVGGPVPMPGAHGLKHVAATPAEVFRKPGDNPLAEGVSFRVQGESAAGLAIGDPRWNKLN